MEVLNFPFDSNYILRKKKSIKKELLLKNNLVEKRIAILAGSTIGYIKDILEIFLLNEGIKPVFYECQYGMYYEEIIFMNDELKKFNPELIYIHTNNRNIDVFPEISDTLEEIDKKLNIQFEKFSAIWDKAIQTFNCPIIQNNNELLSYRLLGNRDVYDFNGRTNFITRLNMLFYQYAASHKNFYINDINYLSSWYGLEQWSLSLYWYMYKYALNINAIPLLCHNISNIIKSIYGKNKKGIVIDLDNTLWGGVIGDVGVSGIEIGQETAIGQAYYNFQQYIKELKSLGIVLAVNSKNDYNNALVGLRHPDGVLKESDFITIKANWNNKNENMIDILDEINILPESIIYIDDNPAERELVSLSMKEIATPKMDNVENFINVIDKSGFFEVTSISTDDLNRTEYYKANELRKKEKIKFIDYNDYLTSLAMKCEIGKFKPIYLERITQLVNKTNQFNLTSRRYTFAEIESISSNSNYLTLYAKLSDKFGDNGVVSIIIGRRESETIHIDLWVMSCRVFKRNLEYCMFKKLLDLCKRENINKIRGYYYKTNKNKMVSSFYKDLGFNKVDEDKLGNSVWSFPVSKPYIYNSEVMKVE